MYLRRQQLLWRPLLRAATLAARTLSSDQIPDLAAQIGRGKRVQGLIAAAERCGDILADFLVADALVSSVLHEFGCLQEAVANIDNYNHM